MSILQRKGIPLNLINPEVTCDSSDVIENSFASSDVYQIVTT